MGSKFGPGGSGAGADVWKILVTHLIGGKHVSWELKMDKSAKICL